MSWTRIYGLALWLLPATLRHKHGAAMKDLFARELGRASAGGRLHTTLVALAGLWDVARRSIYENVRQGQGASAERQGTDAKFGDPPMPQLTTRQLLRRHARSFAIAFGALTASLLGLFASQKVPMPIARGESFGAILNVLFLSVPFTAALTIPMAVFVSVLYEFTRLRADGTLAAARRERHGVRRLVVPVLRAAVGVTALAFVVTAEIVPRTNARLSSVEVGHATRKGDREMTMSELRAATRELRPGVDAFDLRRASVYEVEFQKKLALPASCLVMAVIGMALALRIPRGRATLVIGASCTVFGAYYSLMITGEDLAQRLVVSPFIAMWTANAVMLLAALLAGWSRRTSAGPPRQTNVAILGRMSQSG